MSIASVTIFVYACIAFIFSAKSPIFAERLDGTVGEALRKFLANASSAVPFSLFELIILFSPIILFAILFRIFRAKDLKKSKSIFISALTALSLFVSLYILTIGISNLSNDKYIKLLPQNSEFSNEKLYSAADKILLQLWDNNPEKGSMSASDTAAELEEAYSKLLSERVTLKKPKKIHFSTLFSYTGATALYSFPTGEVNLNTLIPNYILPFTLAHEYAHFIGAGSELDANFLAVAACIESDVPYIKYSGYLCALEYILSDIRKESANMYTYIYKSLPVYVTKDIKEYSEFSKKYHKGTAFAIFSGANKVHLDNFDMHGRASYSAVTKALAVYIDNLL